MSQVTSNTSQTTQSKLISYTSSISTFTERQAQKFPLNTFFSLQVFRVFYSGVDFIGGILQYPLAALQLPFGSVLPCKQSEIQTAINYSRYRNINTDII